MVFSSSVFMFLFLPTVLLLYYTICRNKKSLKNSLLFLSSIFFYAWGEPLVVFLMLFSIVINYFLGLLMNNKNKRVFLALSIVFNLSFLFVFKYLDFALETIGFILQRDFVKTNIALPIGISVYTFQAMSYIIDVFRGQVKPQKNFINLGLYIALFPQLIAGPIVRYSTIEKQILGREENITLFSAGIERFIVGLSKKMIIANNIGFLADTVYSMKDSELSMSFVWLAAIAYSIQIYFDFSAYSDMAIGLGQMFGFQFEENFNYPYISKSITEFWRRWHISLSTWFKDYVYIPLGGNRVKPARHIFNLFVTWLCTGIWHGANWTFIVWGLFFFLFLILEKFLKLDKILKYVGNAYTLLVVIISWVIFRADSLDHAIFYIFKMFSFDIASFADKDFLWYLQNFAVILLLGIVFSTPIAKVLSEKMEQKNYGFIKRIVLFVLMLLSVSFMLRSSYNPFIYFNF